jgi:hypothetical protein
MTSGIYLWTWASMQGVIERAFLTGFGDPCSFFSPSVVTFSHGVGDHFFSHPVWMTWHYIWHPIAI